MKTTNLFFLSFLIFTFLCSTTLSKNKKFKTKQGCYELNPAYYRFDPSWRLSNGYGEFSFQGQGDVSVRLHNQMDNSSFQYWVQVAGWNNTMSRVSRGADGYVVCDSSFTNPKHDI
jgi:hypothetical protein